MVRLPVVTAKQAAREAMQLGFVLDRKNGNHADYYHEQDWACVVIPIHVGTRLNQPCATPFCVPVNCITPSNDSVGTPARVRKHLPLSDRAYGRRRSRGPRLISL